MDTTTKVVPSVKLVLHTSNLAKVQVFYSAVGIKWVEGYERKIEDTFRPDGPAGEMGLPFLWGDFENLELVFYFRESGTTTLLPNTEIVICFPDVGQAARVMELLRNAGVFLPAPDFDEFTPVVVDPDGRRVLLWDPNPFSCL